MFLFWNEENHNFEYEFQLKFHLLILILLLTISSYHCWTISLSNVQMENSKAVESKVKQFLAKLPTPNLSSKSSLLSLISSQVIFHATILWSILFMNLLIILECQICLEIWKWWRGDRHNSCYPDIAEKLELVLPKL